MEAVAEVKVLVLGVGIASNKCLVMIVFIEEGFCHLHFRRGDPCVRHP